MGDLAGFVASTYLPAAPHTGTNVQRCHALFPSRRYMRGCTLVQVPTTLMACVDSSIGGKTAVNVQQGHVQLKNVIGTFYPPSRVYIDIACIASLPPRLFSNGMAEVIKCAILASPALYAFLSSSSPAHIQSQPGALAFVICSAIDIKAAVVEEDPTEMTGVRELLNLGHTAGHAIEAACGQLLHGECVAAGLVCELSVAAALGHLPFHLLPPLLQLLDTYNLPFQPLCPLPLAAAAAALFKDKKNASAVPGSDACVNVVLMSAIGCPVARKSLPVPAWLVTSCMARSISITPPCRPIVAKLQVPGSKSISNRALLLAALCPHPVVLHGMLHCDDTHVMIEALNTLFSSPAAVTRNADGSVTVDSGGRCLRGEGCSINIANSGTSSRFLLAALALSPGSSVTITGDTRMHERPQGDLVDALKCAGASVEYKGTHGCLPVQVSGCSLQANELRVATGTSSQFLSGLLMAAAAADGEGPVSVKSASDSVVSEPYVRMTCSMMNEFGCRVQEAGNGCWTVPRCGYNRISDTEGDRERDDSDKDPSASSSVSPVSRAPRPSSSYSIEPDASSATYFLAMAAVTGGRVVARGLLPPPSSMQGDASFYEYLDLFGCSSGVDVDDNEDAGAGIYVQGPAVSAVPLSLALRDSARGGGQALVELFRQLDEGVIDAGDILQAPPGAVDMSDCTDAFMTLAAVAACSRGVTRIVGVGNQRVKECNRIAATVQALLACGIRARELPTGIEVEGAMTSLQHAQDLRPCTIACHDDHRMAMAAAVLGCIMPSVMVDCKACVSKTYPEFWLHCVRFAGLRLNPDPPQLQDNHQQRLQQQVGSSVPPPIIIIGMRGSGKTTVGIALARSLSRDFYDCDECLQRQVAGGGTLAAFIEKSGWEVFRREEVRVLDEILKGKGGPPTLPRDEATVASEQRRSAGPVVSTGGGIVETREGRDFLASAKSSGSVVIWLHRDAEAVAATLMPSASPAPAPLDARAPLPDSFEVTWARRKVHYEALCTYELYSPPSFTPQLTLVCLRHLLRRAMPSPSTSTCVVGLSPTCPIPLGKAVIR